MRDVRFGVHGFHLPRRSPSRSQRRSHLDPSRSPVGGGRVMRRRRVRLRRLLSAAPYGIDSHRLATGRGAPCPKATVHHALRQGDRRQQRRIGFASFRPRFLSLTPPRRGRALPSRECRNGCSWRQWSPSSPVRKTKLHREPRPRPARRPLRRPRRLPPRRAPRRPPRPPLLRSLRTIARAARPERAPSPSRARQREARG